MGTYTAEKTLERPFVSPPALFALSAMDRACIEHLVGHTLARVEREFILQTLRRHLGNRTHAADRLGISVRSLRDRIRNYRTQGECVPNPRDGGPKLQPAHCRADAERRFPPPWSVDETEACFIVRDKNGPSGSTNRSQVCSRAMQLPIV